MVEHDGFSRTSDRTVHRLYWLAVVICCGIIGLGILSQFSASNIWDDAYMFVRYADNILAYKKVAWNPGGEATYGLTSILFLVVVLPLRLLVPDNSALVAVLSSLVCGFLFLGLLVVTLERYIDASLAVRRVLIAFTLFVLAASIESLAAHFRGGMDTTFVLAYLTAYILISKWYERSSSMASTILMGVWGGLAFYVRPDLMLYAFIVPASIAIFAPGLKAKRNGLVLLGITAVVVGTQVGFAYRYLDSPLPLPFYAKGLGIYGDSVTERYRLVPISQLFLYVLSYWCFFLMIGAVVFINFKQWRSTISPVEKGLLIATILFILYYLFFVLQILYSDQRFYYPTLPAIAFLASQSAASFVRSMPQSTRQEVRDSSRSLWLLIVLFLLVSLLPAVLSISRNMGSGHFKSSLAHFTVLNSYKSTWYARWFCLDEFSTLPNDLVIATTEVGHPAALNPDKTIVDLAGLNETDFAHKGFSADLLFQKYQPDLIYMPDPLYEQMIEQISGNPYFIEHYDYFSAQELDVRMGVALRRDSKYYSAMREIAENRGIPCQGGDYTDEYEVSSEGGD